MQSGSLTERAWPGADCLGLVARYGEADTLPNLPGSLQLDLL